MISAKEADALVNVTVDTEIARIEARIRNDAKLTTFPGAFVDWDNASRYKKRATVFRGASPTAFKHWFSKLLDSMQQRHLPEDLIFLNAWNEWSEGAYLEPDIKFGLQYLDAIKTVLMSNTEAR